MVAFSIIFAASFSALVAAQTAQTLINELQLPTSDPGCTMCTPDLASDFAANQAATQCTSSFAGNFFECLICSSQTGTLSPQGVSLSDIQSVAEFAMDSCDSADLPIEVDIGADGSVSVQEDDSSSSGDSSSSSGDSDSPDSSPSSTDSPASPTPTGTTTTKKSGGQRVTSRAGIVLSITLGMAFFALI